LSFTVPTKGFFIMNKFLTTIGLALVTLAAIWGGFWLTNRSGQTTENLSLPAVSESAEHMTNGVAGATGAAMNKTGAAVSGAAGAVTGAVAGTAGHVGNAAGAMMEHGKNMADNAGAAAANTAANAAEMAKTAADKAANAANVLQQEAEKMGVSHEQAMLLPNMGAGWHVVAKTEKANTLKIKEAKTGMEYLAVSERVGNTKRTTLLNVNTNEKVREFTAQIQ
jgi:hypothetical protein